MRKRILLMLASMLLFACGDWTGNQGASTAYAKTSMIHGTIPKSYGRLVTAFADSIGTGIVFEDDNGVIRFVSINGMKEGQLSRY
jgi:hypothetical protein